MDKPVVGQVQPEALQRIGYGLYVVSSVMDGRANGQIANAVIQVCAEPVAIVACLNKKNLTHQYVATSRKFAVSVLSEETPLQFIGRFGFKSGRDTDKFAGIETISGITGIPIVTQYVTAYYEVEVDRELDAWTHTLFEGRVVGARILSAAAPMSYAFYRDVKRGVTHKNSPSYIEGT